jgi:hypothetical protein
MAIGSLIVETDNLIELDGLQDQSTSAYINDATVTVTLLDSSGSEVAGETWPLTMGYVAASNGKYRATLADTLSLSPNKRYQAKVVADGGSGKKRTWYHATSAVRG